MKVRIQNRMGTQVEIPRLESNLYAYHLFYLDKAERLICKNVLGRREVIAPPYTVHRHFLGTTESTTKEVT